MSAMSASSSPAPFPMSGPPSTSAASSPPSALDKASESGAAEEGAQGDVMDTDTVDTDPEAASRYARLQHLLQKSTVYANLIKEQMDIAKTRQRRANPGSGDGQTGFRQPALITYAPMKDYQLEGVEWMIGLHQNGISGILADEMGLGKTLQTLAFCAYLRAQRTLLPFLVVCPLSVLHGWAAEAARWAPDIPVCVYHGTPAERAELRRTVMRPPADNGDQPAPANQNEEKSSQDEVIVDRSTAKGNNAKGKNAKVPNGKSKQTQTTLSFGQKANKPAPKAESPLKTKSATKNKGKGKKQAEKAVPAPRRSTRTTRAAAPVVEDDVEDGPEDEDEEYHAESDDDSAKASSHAKPKSTPNAEAATQPAHQFPMVLTTPDILMRDVTHLSKYTWEYIVVDEGHRLKNFDCKLMRSVKKLDSHGRLVLTGTPLHNNLAELWSLLNFILPDIFSDLDMFQSWFNLDTMQSSLSSSRSSEVIHTLHGILKPFLLRRVKADVLSSEDWFAQEDGDVREGSDGAPEMRGLPPKKEYILWAPLTVGQRKLYDQALSGDLKKYLLGELDKEADGLKRKAEVVEANGDEKEGRRTRSRKAKKRRKYDVDGDDDEYFDRLEHGDDEEDEKENEDDIHELGRLHQLKMAQKRVYNQNLNNPLMQLRKVCAHPFLFDWPVSPVDQQPIVDDTLVRASGKMMVLDRLLTALFARGHRVLLFTQFKTMLNIIEAWATEHKGWDIFRIDGDTPAEDRRAQMNTFQTSPSAPKLFLLTTHAGGLGVTLTAADTVVFYDQDWNPQNDIQAQDRAHRIGQSKPVLVYRLVSRHTVEERIMQRAGEKRKLEALVIAKGKFKAPTAIAPSGKRETMAEMEARLLQLQAEKIEVVSDGTGDGVIGDADLERLLDRSPDVFRERAQAEMVQERGGAFAVYEGRKADEGNLLKGIMGELEE